MNFLEERIMKDGIVKAGNVLKVDSFLNHQMDIPLIEEIGREFKRRFGHKNITKVMTIEASGIGIACIVAQHFGVPVVFAKKAGLERTFFDETVTRPSLMFAGRTTRISVSDHETYELEVSLLPPNSTKLVSRILPRSFPVIVIRSPGAPTGGVI